MTQQRKCLPLSHKDMYAVLRESPVLSGIMAFLPCVPCVDCLGASTAVGSQPASAGVGARLNKATRQQQQQEPGFRAAAPVKVGVQEVLLCHFLSPPVVCDGGPSVL